MGRRIVLAGMSLFCSFYAFSQNGVFNENPVAIRYLLKHEGLQGKVKKVSLKDSTGKLISQVAYDTKGRMTKKLVGSDRTAVIDHFSYDSVTQTVLQRMEYATGEKVYYKYAYNSNGDITKYYIANQAGTMFYSKRLYQYQDSLLVADSAYIPSNSDYLIMYQYNSKGQVTNSKTYTQKGRVLVAETTYEYKMQEGLSLVKIQSSTDYSGNGRFESATSIKYFNNNRQLIKEQNIGATQYSVRPRELTYKLDASGNWISNSKKETREIEYYESLPAAGKEITAASGTNKTGLSVILDENFDNNNNNKWTLWENEGSAAAFYNGYYRVTNKQSNNLLSWLNVPGLAADQLKDFAIETRVYLHTTETGNPNDSYWLLWGIGNNGKDYHAFGIYPDGRFQYGKLAGNAWNAMAGAMRSSFIYAGSNKANILRVEKRKEDIYFLINGKEVHKAKYEPFLSGYTGVGFQFNNKKMIDIDYLYISSGMNATATQSPEPNETNYQKELSVANDSKSRAAALAKYLNEVFLKTDSLTFSNLLGQKLQQMAEIDFYAISEMLMTNKGPNEYKIRMHLLKVIPSDQRQIIIAYSNCIVENFQRRQNSLPEQTCPPAHLPQPGFGLGKKVSSNKPGVAVVPNNGNVNPSPVKQHEPPADPLAVLKQRAKYLEGQTVYIVLKKTCYYVPQKINITSLNDEVTLTAIGSHYTYSYSAGRNVFGTRSLSSITQQLKVADLVRGIDNVSGYYLVTELGPCGSCAGSGGSWNNSSRTRSYCNHCGATGCVPTAVWNNGSSRAF